MHIEQTEVKQVWFKLEGSRLPHYSAPSSLTGISEGVEEHVERVL